MLWLMSIKATNDITFKLTVGEARWTHLSLALLALTRLLYITAHYMKAQKQHMDWWNDFLMTLKTDQVANKLCKCTSFRGVVAGGIRIGFKLGVIWVPSTCRPQKTTCSGRDLWQTHKYWSLRITERVEKKKIIASVGYTGAKLAHLFSV